MLDQSIEHLQQMDNLMLSDLTEVGCSKVYPNFFYEHPEKGRSKFRCKSWHCPECHPKNKKKLKNKVIRLSEKYNLRYFGTLTIIWTLSDVDASFVYISRIWNNLLTYIGRKYNKRLVFIKVVERHKRGVGHIHFLTNTFLDIKWLRPTWVKLGGGQQIQLKYTDIQHVSAYISKYFSKNDLNLPKGVRHYSTNLKMEIENKEEGWSLMIERIYEGDNEKRPVDKTDFGNISYSDIYKITINGFEKGIT